MQNIVKLVILGHFLSFYTPKKSKNQNFGKNFLEILSFYTVYQKSQSFMMYGSWDRVRETELFVILDHFLPLYPPNNLKNQNFGKMEKNPGDIIIFHKYIKTNNHMMYGYWDTEWDRQNVSSFWAIFYPFSSLTTQKIKVLKLKKTPGDTIILHRCTLNDNQMMYDS